VVENVIRLVVEPCRAAIDDREVAPVLPLAHERRDGVACRGFDELVAVCVPARYVDVIEDPGPAYFGRPWLIPKFCPQRVCLAKSANFRSEPGYLSPCPPRRQLARYREEDTMQTRLTLRPGMPGTKKLLARYGERLVCVRYLYDEARSRRLKTVELVIDEAIWRGRPRRPRRNDDDLVRVRVAWDETDLRIAVKKAGGIWRPRHKLWEISWNAVRTLGIENRVITG